MPLNRHSFAGTRGARGLVDAPEAAFADEPHDAEGTQLVVLATKKDMGETPEKFGRILVFGDGFGDCLADFFSIFVDFW